MPLDFAIVDAFTDQPFSGNPAAVVMLPEEQPDIWLQQVAAEFNLSETAFLVPREPGHWQLRWFTPTTEVDLCGHATLAASLVLWEGGAPTDQPLHFHTLSGELITRRKSDWIQLNFPRRDPDPVDRVARVEETLGLPVSATGTHGNNLLVELTDANTLRTYRPDFPALASLADKGVILTARAENPDLDFVSRYFAPNEGIPEDPVTGSVHCVLGPYWSDKLNKTQLRAEQCSPRGGRLNLDVDEQRVHLLGQGIAVMRGHLLATP